MLYEIMILVLAFIVMLICYIMGKLVFNRIYPHNAVLIQNVDGNERVVNTRARVIEEKGLKKWLMWKKSTLPKLKGKVLAPKGDQLRIDSKGNYNAIGYITETDEIHWASSSNIGELKPILNTQDRNNYIQDLKNSRALSATNWVQLVVPLGSLIILGIVIVAILVFAKDVAEPVITANTVQLQIQKEQTKQYEIFQRMESQIQLIAQKQGIDLTEDPPN